MTIQELTEEALKLPKKEKNALINALLQSLSVGKSKADEPAMPVYQALWKFGEMYKELKGTNLSGCTLPKNFAYMKKLLLAIYQKEIEKSGDGMTVIADSVLLTDLEAFMRAVSTMQNKWYFNNRFTVQHLAEDFEIIYSQIKNGNSYDRAKRAYNYL